MNRLFGGGKNKGPSNTNLHIQKAKQVDSLRKVGWVQLKVTGKVSIWFFKVATHFKIDLDFDIFTISLLLD